MAEDDLVRLAHRIIELARTDDDDERAAGIREIFAPDYALHSRAFGTITGVEQYIERIAAGNHGIPNKTWVVEDVVAQGDRFALRYSWTAPHGDGTIGTEALEINRVVDGKIVETWNYQDMLSMLVQLGVIADPFAPPE
jgi:predicted ester cyclase